ncbi:CDP-glycerol glycerophosphotransferase family protein [Escherichia coli]
MPFASFFAIAAMTIGKDNNLEADICLHHKMHSHFSLLPKSERITLHSMTDVDVQSLITSSDIMITDYSSASFDMLYQRKPVLFYWFDSQKFFATRGGPLVCPHTGIPGPVITREDALISTLSEYIEKGFSLDKTFSKIANKFFSYRDNNNTKRILELIE